MDRRSSRISGLLGAVIGGPLDNRARSLNGAAVVEDEHWDILLAGEGDDLIAPAAAAQRDRFEAPHSLDLEAVTRARQCLCGDAARVLDQRRVSPMCACGTGV